MRMSWKEFATREARQTLSAWAKATPTPPIPVEDIADLMCELSIDLTKSLPATMAGRLFVEQRIIEVRQDDIHTRQRFTIAHEVGHYRLHVLAEKLHLDGHICSNAQVQADNHQAKFSLPEFSQCEPSKIALSERDQKRIEIEANIFAAELLMPAGIIEEYAERYNNDIRALSQLFDVSFDAMRIRLEKMLLIKSNSNQQTLF